MHFTEMAKKFQPGRLRFVLLNSLVNLLPPLSTLIISLLVVRLISLELWGEYSRLILLITLLTQFAAWGNKEYLSREFSKTPKDLDLLWMENLVSRSLILIPCTLFLLFLPIGIFLKFLLVSMVVIRFTLQSYESILLYRRAYAIKLLTDLFPLLIFIGWLLFFHNYFTLEKLILLTLILDFFKICVLLIFTKLALQHYILSIQLAPLKKAWPFFLLMFTSLLASRADQINASLFLETVEIGKYQILMNFILLIQASSNFILQPFLKNIYRLKFITIKKIALRLFLIGIPLGACGIFVLYYILLLFYQIEFEFVILVIGYLFILPMFYYSPYIFYLFKINKIIPVVAANILASLLLFITSYLLIPIYGNGVLVLLLPAAAIQWLLLGIYKLYVTEQSRREIQIGKA